MSLTRAFGVGFLAIGLIAAAHPARANLILNGSFESGIDLSNPANTPNGTGIAIVNNGDIADWTLNPTTSFAWYMSNIGSYGVAEDGTRFLNLTGHSASQNFAVTAGDTYTVSYYEASRNNGVTTDTITASVSLASGAATGKTTQTVGNAAYNSTIAGWQQFNFSFTPSTSTTATLQFSLASGNGYPVLDNVVVTAVAPVPEPASLALCGLGAIGLLLVVRRKRQA
jgi:hypothetical protein